MASVLTFAEFKQHLKLGIGDREALSSPTDWYGTFINLGYSTLTVSTRIYSVPFRIFIPELETSTTLTTVASQAYVSVPAGLLVCRGLWMGASDDRMLKWITPEDYYRRVGRASMTGSPREYTRLGDKFYLYPTPGQAYTITCYYKQKVTPLAADTDQTIIGDEWDESIVRIATIESMLKLKEYDFATAEKTAFQDYFQNLVNIYAQEQRQMQKWLQPSMIYLNRRY